MKTLIKNQILNFPEFNSGLEKIKNFLVVFALFLGIAGCNQYEDYINDYDHTSVYFGAQKPLRTLVARTDKDYLEFKTGVALGGLRENKKGYSATFEVDVNVLAAVDTTKLFTLLPANCYSIESNNNTFDIPPGKFLGDCLVKINKEQFAALPGSLTKTYALPIKLTGTTADLITAGKDYTVIVIKYIDEHSGSYYCKGWQAEWNGKDTVPGTTIKYAKNDLSSNKIRTLTTLSLTRFNMDGMGALSGATTADQVNHLWINVASGNVEVTTKTGCNAVENLMSSYNPKDNAFKDVPTFTLNYRYSKGGKNYLVNEVLILRQDVEKELRFETW